LQNLSYQISPLCKSIKTSSSHHHYHQLCKHCKEWNMILQLQRKISDPQLLLPTAPHPSPLPPLIIRATGKWWEWEKAVIKLINWGLRNSKHSRQDRGGRRGRSLLVVELWKKLM
jgi:hypothetical protein